MQAPYSNLKIILADDHEIFRDGFRGFLENQEKIDLVAEASNGEQLVALAGRYLPDVILTDIKMPEMDGIEATRIISRLYPQIGIIALSMFGDDNLVIDMLEAGAKGYLLKNAHKKEILEAITTVAKNHPYYCSKTTIKLAQLIAHSRFDPEHLRERQIFNPREKEIMQLICREFSNKEISAALNISVRTVEGHRERILEKINCRNTAGIVLYAIRHRIFVAGDDSL